MADAMRNRHAFYDAEHEMIDGLFQSDEGEDWDKLCGHLDDALANPFLPRWYRAKYEAIRAWDSDFPEENIQRAKDAVEDMRLVLEADDRDADYQEERLGGLRVMIEAVEEAVAEE
ncbi:hypothetical protein LTR08_002630 [Meristemomyces frigidus]|nr:hypothetical protein LTR08_002630 [Meristemomyces frigidus]